MLTTKRAFILYFMVLSERSHHVHQTNGGFAYVGINADYSRKGSFFYRAGHFSITKNLWKSDPGVIILYRIVTRGSLYPWVNILYDSHHGIHCFHAHPCPVSHVFNESSL